MSHRKFEHPRHGSLGSLPRKMASRHRGKGMPCFILFGNWAKFHSAFLKIYFYRQGENILVAPEKRAYQGRHNV